ncbi:MAG: hypothetical protein ACK5BQ_00740 [Ignavibacteria bacterium]|jgi:hypothetical protein
MYRQIVIVFVSVVIWGAATQQAAAQQLLSSNADTEMLSKRFAQSIIKGDFVNGARELQMFAIMDSAAISQMTGRLPDILAKHVVANGPLTEVDWLSTKTRGKSFIRHTYALKSQRNALRCVVVFYKASKGWAVQSFAVDDRIAEEIND